MISDVLVEIRKWYLPNKTQKPYRLSQLAVFTVVMNYTDVRCSLVSNHQAIRRVCDMGVKLVSLQIFISEGNQWLCSLSSHIASWEPPVLTG
jgi:hypothetical protein